MRRRIKVSVIYSVLFFGILLAFTIWQNPTMQLVAMAWLLGMLLLLIINFVGGIVIWKRHRYKSFLPLSICLFTVLFSFIIAPYVGSKIKDRIFYHRLYDYEKVISLFQEKELVAPHELGRVELPKKYQYLGYTVLAELDSEGTLTVEFLTGGGFPVKHLGYLYCSDGNIPPELKYRKRWPYLSRINDNWFRIAD